MYTIKTFLCRSWGTVVIANVLGKGGYGSVYEVVRLDEPESCRYAMKVEKKHQHRLIYKLKMEKQVLQNIAEITSAQRKFFAQLFHAQDFPDKSIIIMSLVGESLSALKRRNVPPTFR